MRVGKRPFMESQLASARELHNTTNAFCGYNLLSTLFCVYSSALIWIIGLGTPESGERRTERFLHLVCTGLLLVRKYFVLLVSMSTLLTFFLLLYRWSVGFTAYGWWNWEGRNSWIGQDTKGVRPIYLISSCYFFTCVWGSCCVSHSRWLKGPKGWIAISLSGGISYEYLTV
ncbi:uncharacterized protein BDZ99DRAFT_108889 [Mytilinidion resinicola]|uniref:Uncharacterized protein n=1 Tax=Mytilinidion resinicola TaxID=574789 RepID=A0A6A6YA05_9PEZI|nr:uncharacterized protein BDZ99DRAFT_108889 [Mytilinidion resinicola]KAF2805646.1 hypothetical protein BDZ99DRAFT_108889 [Mytilinidion resinicola]